MNRLFLTLLLLSSLFFSQAQDANTRPKKTIWQNMALNGYVKNLNTLAIPPGSTPLIWNHLIHNRLNYKWYIHSNLTLEAAARNRLFFGQGHRANYQLNPNYLPQLENDPGLMDLSHNWSFDANHLLHSTMDRLNLQWTYQQLEIKLGRQRVNWGTSLVWNPNDVFNTYNLFDFDYEERAGSDALAIKYYTSATSSLELVIATTQNYADINYAGKYQWNKWGYDFQILAGVFQNHLLTGAGWAGDIKGIGFRGEYSWFIPDGNSNVQHQVLTTVDLDYTWPKGWMVKASYLLNSSGNDAPSGSYTQFFTERPPSVMNLSPVMHTVYLGGGYPIAPMFQVQFFGMFNPSDQSLFLGPTLAYTLSDNWELLLATQFFTGRSQTLYGQRGSLVFGRVKWSF